MSFQFLVLSAVLIVGFVIVAFWLWTLWRYRSLTASFPSLDLPALPIIGHSYIFKGDVTEFVKVVLSKIKTTPAVTWFGPLPVLVITKPEDMSCILKSPHALNRSDLAEWLLGPLFKGGLIVSQVEKWQVHRKIMGPAFSTRNITDFIPKMNENLTKLIETLDHVHGNFDIKKYFLETTFKMSTYMFLGVDFNSKDCQFDLSTSVAAANGYKDIVEKRFHTLWLHPEFTFQLSSIFKTFEKYMNQLKYMRDKVLDGRISSNRNFEVTKNDFLGFLLDATKKNPQFTVQEARDQLITLIIGGYDTTATAAAFACLALAHHSDIQDKLYDELQQFIPDPEQEITAEILDNLIYLDMVTKETLRLFTVIPFSAREVPEPVVLSDGRIIPAGIIVILGFYLTHRDENHWPNAEVFDPERFTAENCEKRHPFAFLPFSGGKRNCIGYKLGMIMTKLMLAKIIRKYHVTTDLTWADVTNFKYGASLSLITDFWVKLTPRE